MVSLPGRALLYFVCGILLLGAMLPAPAQVANQAVGLTLATLSAEDLDAIEQAMGRRLGVQVVEVQAGSPAAAAGIKANDVLFAIGPTGVDTAEKAVAALKAATGTVEIVAASMANGEWQAVQYKLTVAAPAGGGAIGGNNAGAGGAGGEAQPLPADDPVNAYFNMMDFVRTQAWGRQIATPAGERQRVAQLILASLDQIGADGQAALAQFPVIWDGLRKQWEAADAPGKAKLRAEWAQKLLFPTQLYPPPAEVQQYKSPGGEVSLSYPGGWVGAIQEFEGIPFMYLGPPGTETTWDKVIVASTSPPGALFALFQLDDQMRQLPSFVAGARLMAQMTFKQDLPNFKEINVLDLGQNGGIITYLGKFAGQTEEKFYWIGAVPFGANAVVAGRLGGPVAQAETLTPGLHHILSTMQLTPPQPAGGGGGVSGAWEAAWSRVDVAITKNIWAPSGN